MTRPLTFPLSDDALVAIERDLRNLQAFDLASHPPIEVFRALGAAVANLELMVKHVRSLGSDAMTEIAYAAITFEQAHTAWNADQHNTAAWKAYEAARAHLSEVVGDYLLLGERTT